MATGFLSLVLHAHLPFVRHPESDRYLEERWLFEAITETYLPLLFVFEQLVEDCVDFRVTISFSPTLLAMLADPLLRQRYRTYLAQLIDLAEKEWLRTKSNPAEQSLSQMYLERFRKYEQRIRECDGDIVSGYVKLSQLGKLELITASATHAFLPLIKTEEALRAQVETAAVEFERHVGSRPNGIWLPECAYRPGIDEVLVASGYRYFFVDTHGIDNAEPRPLHGVYAPIVTPAGTAVFARDQESGRQVWSSEEGYPGDVWYREYYRDIGYDLDFDYMKPYLHPAGIRHNTGLKYYRITKSEPKQLYDPLRARESAGNQAGHFIAKRQEQIESLCQWMDRPPLIVAPYDAELFGHWWYEGPQWIDFLCRKLYYDQKTVSMIAPSEYLTQYPSLQRCHMGMSTWGRDGYAEVWLNDTNAWVYRSLHKAEERMIDLAENAADPRLANQAARELMLAQSSDWAFIMDNKTMVDYAVRRTKWHIGRFTKLFDMANGTCPYDEAWLEEVERRDSLFPMMDASLYRRRTDAGNRGMVSRDHACQRTVLMFSWEFPPMTVGGLSRHVYDLSRFLVKQGWAVHVLTCEVPGYPLTEIVEGVHVHRVAVLHPAGSEFIEWIYQLNFAMVDAALGMFKAGLQVDILHAHDWLVAFAAKELKLSTGIPLVSTIHATEHGRNQGIHTDLQRRIHGAEWMLTYESWRVICCSQAMHGELQSLFNLPSDKIDVIANGVDIEALRTEESSEWDFQYALPHEKIVFFVGRLVAEKGVQILVQAAPRILAQCPETKFIIAGRGPTMGDLKQRVSDLGITDKVHFAGFVDDETRNRLFSVARVCVFPSLYEPFGIVALEAMATGSPVVVSDVGGMGEIITHDEDGLKVFPGDVDSLTLQVTRLLKDDGLASHVRERATVALRDKYDWRHIAKWTEQTYERVLAEKSSR